MKILVCTTDPDGKTSLRLVGMVEDVLGKKSLRFCRSIPELRKDLRNPWEGVALVLLYAANREELEGYISTQDLLEDIPVIFVLPDRSETTGIRAHALRPRFVTYSDSDFLDLRAVLKKMSAGYRQHPVFEQ